MFGSDKQFLIKISVPSNVLWPVPSRLLASRCQQIQVAPAQPELPYRVSIIHIMSLFRLHVDSECSLMELLIPHISKRSGQISYCSGTYFYPMSPFHIQYFITLNFLSTPAWCSGFLHSLHYNLLCTTGDLFLLH